MVTYSEVCRNILCIDSQYLYSDLLVRTYSLGLQTIVFQAWLKIWNSAENLYQTVGIISIFGWKKSWNNGNIDCCTVVIIMATVIVLIKKIIFWWKSQFKRNHWNNGSFDYRIFNCMLVWYCRCISWCIVENVVCRGWNSYMQIRMTIKEFV